MTHRPVRVLLCDDHPVFREGLAAVLTDLGVDVVGAAGTGEELLELLAAGPAVDVVVVDLHLPGLGGPDLVGRVVRSCPAGVLALSMATDAATVAATLRAGARGYLVKESRAADVRQALDVVAAGGLVVGPGPASSVVAALGRTEHLFPELTDRERQVLEQMARGRANEAIAASLFLSVKTVRNLVSAVLAKTGAASRAEAVARARDAGLGGPG